MAQRKNDEYVISETLRHSGTEPLAVASGLKNQLFKALCTNKFLDSAGTLVAP